MSNGTEYGECPDCGISDCGGACVGDTNGITCPLCQQQMQDRDCAEGCEDINCPFISEEQP